MRHENAPRRQPGASGAVRANLARTKNTTNPWSRDARGCDDDQLAVWASQAQTCIALAHEDTDDPATAENTIGVARLMLSAIQAEQAKRKRAGYQVRPIDRGYPREVLDDLRQRMDLVRLIEADGVTLRRAGRTWKGCCPWHDDNTPSLVVWPDGGFRCFGCGAAGDALTWWQLSHGMSFRDSVTWLCRAYGVDSVKSRPEVVLR